MTRCSNGWIDSFLELFANSCSLICLHATLIQNKKKVKHEKCEALNSRIFVKNGGVRVVEQYSGDDQAFVLFVLQQNTEVFKSHSPLQCFSISIVYRRLEFVEWNVHLLLPFE